MRDGSAKACGLPWVSLGRWKKGSVAPIRVMAAWALPSLPTTVSGMREPSTPMARVPARRNPLLIHPSLKLGTGSAFLLRADRDSGLVVFKPPLSAPYAITSGHSCMTSCPIVSTSFAFCNPLSLPLLRPWRLRR